MIKNYTLLHLCLWWMLLESRWRPDLPEPLTRTLWLLPIHPRQSKHSVQIPLYRLRMFDHWGKSCKTFRLQRIVMLLSLHFLFNYCLIISSSRVILTHPLPQWMALYRRMECSVGFPVWTCELGWLHFPKKHIFYIYFLEHQWQWMCLYLNLT